MKRKKISAKVWASIMAAAMVMSTCPTAAFAVTADKVAADGTYTATRHVYRTIEDTDDEWNEYDVDVTVSVKDGKISDITATPKMATWKLTTAVISAKLTVRKTESRHY